MLFPQEYIFIPSPDTETLPCGTLVANANKCPRFPKAILEFSNRETARKFIMKSLLTKFCTRNMQIRLSSTYIRSHERLSFEIKSTTCICISHLASPNFTCYVVLKQSSFYLDSGFTKKWVWVTLSLFSRARRPLSLRWTLRFSWRSRSL